MPAARLTRIAPLGVDAMGDRADSARDPDVLRLENMDTDVPPPAAAIEATRAAVGLDSANSYLPFLGADELRQAAAAHVSRLSGVTYDWRESCVITAGGMNGLLDTLLATVEPGDEVITAEPIYVGILNRIRLAGADPRFVPYRATPQGWRLDLDALRNAVGDRTRAVVMVSPSMPTGALLNRAEWDAVADVCRSARCWLIYDAPMERILFDGAPHIHPASLPGMAERTITVGSASKEFRMIGWRVGWVVGRPEILRAVGSMVIANTVCPVGIAQAGVAAAFRESDAQFRAVVAEWEARRNALLSELSDWPAIRPAGGWSLLVDVAQLSAARQSSGKELDSRAASDLLLARAKIAATPMINWGGPTAGRYIRFVFANEPVPRLATIASRLRSALPHS
jgi:aspartate/methionine/tyrosine aminotransferase